jgi:hypothetical protein
MQKTLNIILVVILSACPFAVGHSQEIRGAYGIKNEVTGMLLRLVNAHNNNQTPVVAYSPVNAFRNTF